MRLHATFRRSAVACAVMVTMIASAAAATYDAAMSFPDLTQVDDVGVDVVSGLPVFSIPALKFGGGRSLNFPSQGGVFFAGNSLPHTYLGTVQNVPADGFYSDPARRAQLSVSFGSAVERFYATGNGYASVNGGGILVADAQGYDYTSKDGSKVRYKKGIPFRSWLYSPDNAVAVRAQSPTGSVTTINWATDQISINNSTSPYLQGRIQSVEFSDGYMLKIGYEANRVSPSQTPTEAWMRQKTVTAINRAFDYCDPMADSCAAEASWPSARLSWATSVVWQPNTSKFALNELTVTQPNGAETKVKTNVDAKISAIKEAGASVYGTTYEYCAEKDMYNCYWTNGTQDTLIRGRMLKATRNGQSWTYTTSPITLGNYIAIFESRGPRGTKRVVRHIMQNPGVLVQVVEVDGRSVGYSADDRNLPSSSSTPGQATVLPSYDGRGNLLGLVREGVLPSGDPLKIEKKRSFRTDCTAIDPACNKSFEAIDANGGVTSFRHSQVHGQLERQDLPAVDGVRASLRQEYRQYQALFYSAPTTITGSGQPEWKLARSIECTSGAMTEQGACADSAATVVTEYDYLVGQNLAIKSIKRTWNGESRLTCFAYDRHGRQVSEKSYGSTQGECQ